MVLIMELIIKTLFKILLLCVFILNIQKMNAQIEISAKIKGELLKIKICNNTDNVIKVPDLSVRFGEDKIYLFDNYYSIENDSLILTLKEDLDPDLYKIISREPFNGKSEAKFIYIDILLEPNKKYKTKIRLKEDYNIKFLFLKYEELKLECKVK